MGSQAGVGGGQPNSPFLVSLLVAESSDKRRGLREKNEAETGLNHFAPLRPQILQPRKLQPGIPAKRAGGVQRLGTWGPQARLGKLKPSGIVRPPRASLTAGWGRCLAWPLPGNSDLGPLHTQHCNQFYFILLFCLIGYRSVLTLCDFRMQGRPGSLLNLCVYTSLKKVTQWRVYFSVSFQTRWVTGCC